MTQRFKQGDVVAFIGTDFRVSVFGYYDSGDVAIRWFESAVLVWCGVPEWALVLVPAGVLSRAA